MGKISTKRIVRMALFTSIALILSVIENMIPPLLSFAPGAKMGLSNVTSLVALIILGYSDAFIILIARCLLMSIFGGNVSALLYSLPAGLISLSLEILLYQFFIKRISIMSISFLGAVVHNVIQLFVASLIVESNLMAMLPLMMFASVIAGIFVGVSAYCLIKFLPKSIYADLSHMSS